MIREKYFLYLGLFEGLQRTVLDRGGSQYRLVLFTAGMTDYDYRAVLYMKGLLRGESWMIGAQQFEA